MSKQLQQAIDICLSLSANEQIELIKTIIEQLLTKPLEKLKLIDTIFHLLRETFYKSEQLPPSGIISPDRSLTTIIGTGQGSFATPEQADNFIRAERDAWTS